MWPDPKETADLVTFTTEILNGKLHVLCNDTYVLKDWALFIDHHSYTSEQK